jgi:putative peptidoglycan lipid II flippase
VANTDIRRNTLTVGGASLLARVTGVAREMVFAAAFGAGFQADAFNAAFRIGNLFRELFVEGALSNAFIPLFAKTEQNEGAASAWQLANAFLGVLIFALGGVTLGLLLLAEPLVFVVASGFADDPAKVELTARLTRILSPFVACLSVASVFMGMLNVRGRFFLPAACPMLFNVFVIAACATGRIEAVAVAALVGGASQALIQLPSLRKEGFRLALSFGRHPGLRKLLAFLGPAIIAISVVQIHILIEMQLASQQGDGAVSWLLYSFRIAHLPFSIVSGAVGVAALAGLSVLAAEERWGDFRDGLADALNLNNFLLLPSAVGIWLMAEPLVQIMFERGAFTPHDTTMTAMMLRGYAVALLGIGAQRVIVPTFYTLNDPWTPMWAGAATVVVKWPLAVWLMARVDLMGLPLSHAVLVSAEVVVLLALLARRVPGLARPLLSFHIRALVPTVVMAAAVWFTREPLGLGAVVVGIVVYGAVCVPVGLNPLRVLRRRRGPPPPR